MWDLSSLTRDWTHVPCIGRWILNHWTTREVPIIGHFGPFLPVLLPISRRRVTHPPNQGPHLASVTSGSTSIIPLLACILSDSVSAGSFPSLCQDVFSASVLKTKLSRLSLHDPAPNLLSCSLSFLKHACAVCVPSSSHFPPGCPLTSPKPWLLPPVIFTVSCPSSQWHWVNYQVPSVPLCSVSNSFPFPLMVTINFKQTLWFTQLLQSLDWFLMYLAKLCKISLAEIYFIIWLF